MNESIGTNEWVVDRRYREAGQPGQFDLVVRPAADSVEALFDRLKMQVYIGMDGEDARRGGGNMGETREWPKGTERRAREWPLPTLWWKRLETAPLLSPLSSASSPD